MKRGLVFLMFFFSWHNSWCSKTIMPIHCCHHFDTTEKESLNLKPEIKKADSSPGNVPPTPAFSKNFGKTHFIVGTTPDQIQEALGQEAIKPPEQSAQEAVNAPTAIEHAYFAPDDALQKILIDLIAQEKTGIKIAVFFFTSNDIAQALLAAKERGISIELVTDQACKQDKSNKIKFLHQRGIPIYIYKTENTGSIFSNHMHNKFLIFDKNKDGKQLLWFGSYNLTKTANGNQEAVVLSDNKQLIEQFAKQFDLLKERSIRYKSKKIGLHEYPKETKAITKNEHGHKKRSVKRSRKENKHLCV